MTLRSKVLVASVGRRRTAVPGVALINIGSVPVATVRLRPRSVLLRVESFLQADLSDGMRSKDGS